MKKSILLRMALLVASAAMSTTPSLAIDVHYDARQSDHYFTGTTRLTSADPPPSFTTGGLEYIQSSLFEPVTFLLTTPVFTVVDETKYKYELRSFQEVIDRNYTKEHQVRWFRSSVMGQWIRDGATDVTGVFRNEVTVTKLIVTPIPEPGALLLMCLGLGVLAVSSFVKLRWNEVNTGFGRLGVGDA